MCTDGTPASPYLAKWSCTVQAAPSPDVAVARTAAWAKATMDTWGPGGLADDAGLIVAEFSSNARAHRSPPVVVTLLLQESDLTRGVSKNRAARGQIVDHAGFACLGSARTIAPVSWGGPPAVSRCTIPLRHPEQTV